MRSVLIVLVLLTAGLVAAGPVSAAVSDADVRAAFADSYAKEAAGDLAGAVTALTPAAGNRSAEYLYQLRMGWLAYSGGSYERSIGFYTDACGVMPTAIEPRLGLMLPLMGIGNWLEVEKQARLVLRQDPANSTASRWLAESLLAQSRGRDAVLVADRLVEQYPATMTFLELQARARMAIGDRDRAKASYRALLLLDPSNATALAAVGASR